MRHKREQITYICRQQGLCSLNRGMTIWWWHPPLHYSTSSCKSKSLSNFLVLWATGTTAGSAIRFRNPKEGTVLLNLPYLVLEAMMDLILMLWKWQVCLMKESENAESGIKPIFSGSPRKTCKQQDWINRKEKNSEWRSTRNLQMSATYI